MEIRYTRLFSLPEYRYFVCIRSSSLLLNIFRTFCFQWQLCWYWMYWHQMTESVELQTKIFKVDLSQFWWVFRNSRFFLIHHVVIYCTYCVYGCTVTWGQQPRKFLSITEPRSISRKNPVVLFWVSPNWIIADVLLPKSLLNAKDLLRK